MMEAFYTASEFWWNVAESATSLYPTELAEYKLNNPMPQLRDFMKGTF